MSAIVCDDGSRSNAPSAFKNRPKRNKIRRCSVLSAKAIQLFASGRAKYYDTVGQLTDISQFTAVHSTVVIHGRGCVMCIAKNNIRVAHLHAHLVGSFAH
jgi:hypothetical protein